jgi:RNA polymerase sigma factor (sigma-70 family)
MKPATDLEREAADWVVAIGDPDCTKEQLASLDAWLARSPEHARLFQELQGIWSHVDGSENSLVMINGELDGVESQDAEDARELADSAIDVAMACKGVIRAHHRRYASNAEDVQRLVTETYRRLLAIPASELARVRSIPEFLLTAARDLALNQLRKRAVIPTERLADIATLQTLDVDAQIQVIASTDRIMSALTAAYESLPSACRNVFTLYRMHGYTCSEVASKLGISLRSVRERLEQAARLFEEALSNL